MKKMYLFSLFCAIVLLFSCENQETDTGINPGATPDPTVPVKRVTVSPRDAEVVKGGTQQFTAEVEGTAGTPVQSVTWSIVEDHAEGTDISTAGVLAVAEDELALTLTVKATSTADTERHGSATVSITEKPSVVKVEVEPGSTSVSQGHTSQFAAVVTVTGNAAKTVIWSLEGTHKPGTTINQSGLLTVAGDETVGAVFTVRAASTVDTGISGTATVTIAVNIPLSDLIGTIWCWGDRSQGGITVMEFVIESTDPDGVQHGHLNCYRPFDPDQQVYVDWYYYDPATKTGEIEYINKFYITPDNSKLILPQYAQYPHGATFDRIYED